MSSGDSPYPSKIDGRNAYYGVAYPYLVANQGRLKIDPTDMDLLKGIYDNASSDPSKMGWIQLFPLYADKEGSRTTTIKDETLLRDGAMKKQLSKIYNDIPASLWTAQDRNVLGRKGPNTGHHHQSMGETKTEAATGELDPNGKLALDLRIHQSGGAAGATTPKGGMPATVREYIFHWTKRKATDPAPKDPTECTEHDVVTHQPHHLTFIPGDEGMWCSGFIQTIEKPAKEGAISSLVEAVIPG